MTVTTFAYRCADAQGDVRLGRLDAATHLDAVRDLERQHLTILSLREDTGLRWPRRRASAREAASGLRMLADLLSHGLPIAAALQALLDVAPDAWRLALPTAQRDLERGVTVATVLSDSAFGLSPTALGVLRAGETGGFLTRAVELAALATEQQVETREAVRAALAYPLLLCVVSVSSLGFLIGVVLPRFALILRDLGQALPTSTRWLLALGDAVSTGWPLWLVRVTGLLIGQQLFRHPAHRHWVARVVLAVPLLGRIAHGLATARVCQAMGGMLAVGMPVLEAMSRSAAAAGNPAIEGRLLEAQDAVRIGQPLSNALEQSRALTPLALHLLRVGERAGTVAPMLERAAAMASAEALAALRRLVRIIEPTSILVLGGVIALVSAGLLQALYAIRPS